MTNSNQNINSLILSAGFSSRMGDFKPLLNYNGKPIIVGLIAKLVQVSTSAAVVTGHQKELIEKEIHSYFEKEEDRIEIVYNENFASGMFTSLQKGVEHLKSSDWILYHFVDQPALPEEFYYEFVNQIDDGYDWIQPNYHNRNGHPILLNKSLFSMITEAGNNTTLKDISQNPAVKKKYWETNYKGVLNDIDTPDDYRQLMKGKK
jgi:CTP:molybdopterin cytidylyltransferase MocA